MKVINADELHRKSGGVGRGMLRLRHATVSHFVTPSSRLARGKLSNKSFGCPIQAVLWLECATMPAQPFCH